MSKKKTPSEFQGCRCRSKTYIEEALRTMMTKPFVKGDPFLSNLLHAGIGLGTESGEFLDALKKAIIYDRPIDRINLVEECGDILWYLALALRTLDSNFDEAMDANIKKLRVRYGNKFTPKKALKRDLKAERAVFTKPQ